MTFTIFRELINFLVSNQDKVLISCLYVNKQIGNRKLLTENGIAIPSNVENFVVELEESAKTGILVAQDNVVIGALGIADPLKREAAVVVEGLIKMGVQPIMVTGDNWRTARAVAKEVCSFIFVIVIFFYTVI